jgi:two-component system, OmpR family, sensor kinase
MRRPTSRGGAELSLHQVETMRRRAAAISSDTPGERLPVPRTGDELQRLGETLNEMLARLEAAIERERTFVADAGHEQRTPLALLRTKLELALHQGRTTDELREAIRRSSHEADRLSQLAEDLLLIARPTADVYHCSSTTLRSTPRRRRRQPRRAAVEQPRRTARPR